MKSLIHKWQSQHRDEKYLESISKKVIAAKSKNHQLAQEVHQDVFDEIDCLQCANCCKTIPPMLSKRDIKRIAQRLGMSRVAFMEKYIIVDEDGDAVINTSPCPFLQADNKCGIYEDRPAACRLYPHSGDYLFYENLQHHKRNMKYCPGLLEIMKRLAKVKTN